LLDEIVSVYPEVVEISSPSPDKRRAQSSAIGEVQTKAGARLPHSKMGSGTRLGFGLLRGLRGDGLIDLKKSHFQFAEEIEEQ
jgi:hypothetical protein